MPSSIMQKKMIIKISGKKVNYYSNAVTLWEGMHGGIGAYI